jgi:hypothetical protein
LENEYKTLWRNQPLPKKIKEEITNSLSAAAVGAPAAS